MAGPEEAPNPGFLGSSDVAPSLLTNRTVRNYLQNYSQQAWPQVTKLTLIYGIVALQQQYPGRNLTLQQLKQVVEACATTVVVQQNVPQLQRQILSLQSELDNVFDRLAIDPLQAAAPAAPGSPAEWAVANEHTSEAGRQPQQQVYQQQQQRRQVRLPVEVPVPQAGAAAALQPRQRRLGSNPAVAAPKPSDAWRKGEGSGYSSPLRPQHPLRRSQDNQGATNPIYPDWWLERPSVQEQAAQLQQQQPAKAPGQQPRLAYSVPKQQQQQTLDGGGLATAEHDLQLQQVVPGDQPPFMITHITPSSITTDNTRYAGQQLEPTLQQQPRHPAAAAARPGGVGQGGSGGVFSRGPRGKHVVQSKVRQQVAASRQQAAARLQHRQQLLTSVVATTSSCPEQAEQQQEGEAAAAQAASDVYCPSAATAEQFIFNPWTSWFLPGAAPDLSAGSFAVVGTAASVDDGASEAESSQSAAAAAFEPAGWTANTADGAGSMMVAPAGLGPSRGALQDITGGLNQPVSSSSFSGSAAAQEGWCTKQQGSGRVAADGAAAGYMREQGAEAGLLLPSQGQQGAGQQQRQQAWAADFGHLDLPQLGLAADTAAESQRQHMRHHRQQWSQTWVGDFGHLDMQRFSKETAFSHHQQLQHTHTAAGEEDSDGAAAAAGSGGKGFLMSPADLQSLVAAASLPCSPAGVVPRQEEGPAAQPTLGGAGPAVASTSNQDLGVRLTALLQQWDQQSAGTGDGRHAGIEARTAALQMHAAADACGSVTAGSETDASLLRMHGEIQETGSPIKPQQHAVQAASSSGTHGCGAEDLSGPAGSAVELADDYLEGLAETSHMLAQALQQHSSVMKLIAGLEGQQVAGEVEQQSGGAGGGWQQEDAGDEALRGGSSAAAHTAAWVAATTAADGAEGPSAL